MSIDVRTRVDGPVGVVDPGRFFGATLPHAFDDGAERIAPGARWMAPKPLTVLVDGGAWSLSVDDGVVTITPGAGPGDTMELTLEQLTDLVNDLVTPTAWLITGSQPGTATISHQLDWWVLLRAALDGRVPHTPGSVTFREPDGSPLDLGRTFRPDDPPQDMLWFLEQAGFLHIAGLFSQAEMEQVSAEMDHAAPGYERGDGRSWWARTASGDDRLVRMMAFRGRSQATARLLDDPRFRTLGDLPGAGHVAGYEGRPPDAEALIKPIGVVEGISDVPWHKDCSQGRHSYECSSLTVGVSVTGADATSGQLRVVAGSHRALVWPTFVRDGLDLPQIDLPTSTGDVTVHLSCTTHMSQPPVDRERRVLYSGFGLPPADPAAARTGRAKVVAARVAAPTSISQRPATSGHPSGSGEHDSHPAH